MLYQHGRLHASTRVLVEASSFHDILSANLIFFQLWWRLSLAASSHSCPHHHSLHYHMSMRTAERDHPGGAGSRSAVQCFLDMQMACVIMMCGSSHNSSTLVLWDLVFQPAIHHCETWGWCLVFQFQQAAIPIPNSTTTTTTPWCSHPLPWEEGGRPCCRPAGHLLSLILLLVPPQQSAFFTVTCYSYRKKNNTQYYSLSLSLSTPPPLIL